MAGLSFVSKLVNASENGDFNRGHTNFQTECSKCLLRAAKKTKTSWTYMTENGVDSLYLFLYHGSRMVASPAHPDGRKHK